MMIAGVSANHDNDNLTLENNMTTLEKSKNPNDEWYNPKVHDIYYVGETYKAKDFKVEKCVVTNLIDAPLSIKKESAKLDVKNYVNNWAKKGHIYKKGKYSVKVTPKQYKKILYVKAMNKIDHKHNYQVHFSIKTGKFIKKTIKTTKYKKIKVYYRSWESKSYTPHKTANLKYYYKHGWKKVKKGSSYYMKNNCFCHDWVILKKPVIHKKTVKMRLYAKIGTHMGINPEHKFSIPTIQFIAKKNKCPTQYLTGKCKL